MNADSRPRIRPHAGSLGTALLLVGACSVAPPASAWPETPVPPNGWTSLGGVRGAASDGRLVSRLTFSGRPIAINAACRGDGTLFVIVDWTDVSPSSGPATFEASAFPCVGPVDASMSSRIEGTNPPTGSADVNIFVVEGQSAVGDASFAVSIEERDP